MAHFLWLIASLLIVLLCNSYHAEAAAISRGTALGKNGIVHPSISGGHWVDTWTAMPQLTEFTNLPNAPFVRV